MQARSPEDARPTRAICAAARRDLDWITLKALEKDRARRYASASEFAADISRYLHDEPVVATPPSATYRARKFCPQKRVFVSAAGLVAGVVVAGLVVIGVLYLRKETPGWRRTPNDSGRMRRARRTVTNGRR
jgi:hypothetical protein